MDNKPFESNKAAQNLESKTKKYLAIGFIVTIVGIFVSIVFYTLGQQKIGVMTSVQQELSSLLQAQNSSDSLKQFVASQTDSIDVLLRVFPDEDSFLQFLSALETLTINTDPNVNLNFTEPVQLPDEELIIPVTIIMQANAGEISELLKQIELLPYIFTVTSIDYRFQNGVNDDAIVTIGGRVYVKDPFR